MKTKVLFISVIVAFIATSCGSNFSSDPYSGNCQVEKIIYDDSGNRMGLVIKSLEGKKQKHKVGIFQTSKVSLRDIIKQAKAGEKYYIELQYRDGQEYARAEEMHNPRKKDKYQSAWEDYTGKVEIYDFRPHPKAPKSLEYAVLKDEENRLHFIILSGDEKSNMLKNSRKGKKFNATIFHPAGEEEGILFKLSPL
jgi:hypothetical protein